MFRTILYSFNVSDNIEAISEFHARLWKGVPPVWKLIAYAWRGKIHNDSLIVRVNVSKEAYFLMFGIMQVSPFVMDVIRIS